MSQRWDMAIRVESADLMSIQQAARELDIPRTTMYRWAERGKIITIRLGGILFVPTSEIERLRKEHTNAETARLAGGSQKGA